MDGERNLVTVTSCPNGHFHRMGFTRHVAAARIESNMFTYHCPTCQVEWRPSEEEINNMREQLAEGETTA